MSCTWDTQNLSTRAVSSTDTKTDRNKQKGTTKIFMFHVSHVTCHVSCVMCHMTHAVCHLVPVTNANSPRPSSANSLIMHSRLNCTDPKKKQKKSKAKNY